VCGKLIRTIKRVQKARKGEVGGVSRNVGSMGRKKILVRKGGGKARHAERGEISERRGSSNELKQGRDLTEREE